MMIEPLQQSRRDQFVSSLEKFEVTEVDSFGSMQEADAANDRYYARLHPVERLILLENLRQWNYGYVAGTEPQLRRSAEMLKIEERSLHDHRRICG